MFIHGTLERAYRFWKSEADPPDFPWSCVKRKRRGDTPNWADHDIGKFADEVEESLRRQGVRARNRKERDSAYGRVGTVVNALGAHMFPLIDGVEHVEYKVSATRPMPQNGSNAGYELRGVLDALARAVRLPDMDGNLIRKYVMKDCPDIKRNSELILEYKGAPRPARGKSLWIQDELQVQAYAWLLRERQSGKLPAAGIVIYVNELSSPTPTKCELDKAIRVIPISPQSVDSAITQIDDVACRIQDALADEETDGNIIRSWQPNCQDKSVCRDCDFRHFCPQPAGTPPNYAIKAPTAP